MNIALDSRHKMGDTVVVDFGPHGKLFSCKIAGIKFTDYGKVLYDIRVFPYSHEEDGDSKDITNVILDIDSCRIITPIEDLLPPNN